MSGSTTKPPRPPKPGSAIEIQRRMDERQAQAREQSHVELHRYYNKHETFAVGGIFVETALVLDSQGAGDYLLDCARHAPIHVGFAKRLRRAITEQYGRFPPEMDGKLRKLWPDAPLDYFASPSGGGMGNSWVSAGQYADWLIWAGRCAPRHAVFLERVAAELRQATIVCLPAT